MPVIESIWWVLILIGIMIMVHELGHYWAARFFDVKVETFSFGFGPRLFGFRRGETDFRVSAILFGGYVKMSGEQPGDEASNDPRGFLAKPRWQRLIIAFAGPWMNILLAVVVLTGLYMVAYPKSPESTIVGLVLPATPAAKAGMQEGDHIIALDGRQNPTWEDLQLAEMANAGRRIQLTVVRGSQTMELSLTPELDERTGVGRTGYFGQAEIELEAVDPAMDAARKGLQPGDLIKSVNGTPIRSAYRLRELVKASQGKPIELVYSRNGQHQTVSVTPTWKVIDGAGSFMIGVHQRPKIEYITLNFPDAIQESVRTNIKSAGIIYQLLQGIVERRMSAKSLEGPIGIANLSREAAKQGPGTFLALMAMVSLNLAVFNLLPIPLLDGGVILLLLLEMLRGKDFSLQFKEGVMKFGFVFLMAVVLFVFYNDISKLLSRS